MSRCLGRWPAVLLVMAACRFNSAVPPQVVVACDGDEACPPGQKCQGGTCVDQARFDAIAPALEGAASVSYLERGGRLPRPPQALGPRSVARVTFQTTEPVAPPTVSACDGVGCSQVEATGLLFTFACVLSPGATPAQSCALKANLVDLAGNPGSADLPSLSVDVEAPQALPVDTEGQVVLTRVPWGAERSPGQSLLQLDVGALAPDEAVVTYPSAASDAPTLQVGDYGQTRLLSPGVDRAELFAAVFDRAGNQSATRRVRDVVLVASLGTTAQGTANPNRFFTSGVHAAGYARPDLLASSEGQGLEVPGGAAVVSLGGGVWRQRYHAKTPRARYAASTFDAARARAVVYGGCNCVRDAGIDPSDNLFEWNGESWQPISPRDVEGDGNPPALVGAAMAWDARREQTVLFGGFTGQRTSSDTWVWNGVSWLKAAPATSPPARRQHAMAFDARRRQVVLFGGVSEDGGLLGDTWAFDGLSWREVTSAAAPSPRFAHAMAYDPRARGLVLTGGQTQLGPTWDGWRFDGTTWAPDPALLGLQARAGHSLVFDTERDQLLCLAGQFADGGQETDVWAQSDAGWEALDAGPPSGVFHRAFGQVVYDAARRATVVHGGMSYPDVANNVGDLYAQILNDATYGFGSDGYEQLALSSSIFLTPQPRINHAMAWDPDRRVSVVQGGEYGPNRYDSTYEWDGVRWTAWLPALPNAGLRTYHAMGFDPVSHQMAMFGGLGEPGSSRAVVDATVTAELVDAGTWVGSRDGGWERRALAGPPVRLAFGMATVPGLGLVAVGGSAQLPGQPTIKLNNSSAIYGDAWVFDGTWRRLPDLNILAAGAAVAFDAARGRVVVMPGPIPFFPTQPMAELDVADLAAGWKQIVPPTRVPQRAQENLLYDTSRQRVLHYGAPLAAQGEYASDRVWEWDGMDFHEVQVFNAEGFGEPGTRSGFRWVYDERRRRAVLFGGITADVWELETGTRTPGQVLELGLEQAQVPTQAEVRGLEVSVIAGADSTLALEDGGFSPVAGVALLAWQDDGWSRPLVQTTDPAADAGRFTASLGPTAAARLSGAERVHFALTPRGASGPGGATLSTDYLEATVRYRLP